MRILAIETSAQVASIAVVSLEGLLGELTLNTGLTHSQKLMPAIDGLLGQLEMTLKDIEGIAVASGPGSFTGVRIGMATVKGMAHGAGVPIYPVSSLEGLAWNLAGGAGLVCPVMDARRDQVYTALFDCSSEVPQRLMDDSALAIDVLSEKLKLYSEPIWFVGDGLKRFKDTLAELMGEQARFPQNHLWLQKASSVGMAALLGSTIPDALEYGAAQPEYLRPSQAERMREERHGT